MHVEIVLMQKIVVVLVESGGALEQVLQLAFSQLALINVTLTFWRRTFFFLNFSTPCI